MTGHDMDLPFEPSSGPLADEHVHLASGVVVMAATVPIDGAGLLPALVFRFAIPDGSGFYPPVLLVTDDDQLGKLVPLVDQAAAAAREAAKR